MVGSSRYSCPVRLLRRCRRSRQPSAEHRVGPDTVFVKIAERLLNAADGTTDIGKETRGVHLLRVSRRRLHDVSAI